MKTYYEIEWEEWRGTWRWPKLYPASYTGPAEIKGNWIHFNGTKKNMKGLHFKAAKPISRYKYLKFKKTEKKNCKFNNQRGKSIMRELTPKEKLKIEKLELWLEDHEYGENADFQDHDFSNADLEGVTLSQANLSKANLKGANLREANLRLADLKGANLEGANLSYADLSNANLSEARLIVLHLPIWTAYVQLTHTRIGCQYFKNEKWRELTNMQIYLMDSRALDWWKIHKPLILAAMDAVAAQEIVNEKRT